MIDAYDHSLRGLRALVDVLLVHGQRGGACVDVAKNLGTNWKGLFEMTHLHVNRSAKRRDILRRFDLFRAAAVKECARRIRARSR